MVSGKGVMSAPPAHIPRGDGYDASGKYNSIRAGRGDGASCARWALPAGAARANGTAHTAPVPSPRPPPRTEMHFLEPRRRVPPNDQRGGGTWVTPRAGAGSMDDKVAKL